MGETMMPRHTRRPTGFILLEVMVSVLILGVAMVALMQGFGKSLDQIRKVRRTEVGILLGKTMLDDLTLVPQEEGRYEGSFAKDPRFGEEYQSWFWEIEIEAVEPKYDERPKGNISQELENYYLARIRILYADEEESGAGRRRSRNDRVLVHDLQTILIEADVFSVPAIQGNHYY